MTRCGFLFFVLAQTTCIDGRAQLALPERPRCFVDARAAFRSQRFVDVKAALAGGLAGGLTNGLLHPIDTAKTLRQQQPNVYRTTFAALCSTISQRGPGALYGGFIPAILGSIPSSAIYFGTYESVKRRLRKVARNWEAHSGQVGFAIRTRPLCHVFAAASGAPKEAACQLILTQLY